MNKAFYNGLLALAAVLTLANCGKKDDGGGSNGTVATTPIATTCPVGQIAHPQYGCLNQAGCMPGQAMYQNGCISVPIVTSCTTGQIMNPLYGCLNQGSCQVGYGTYGGSCFPPGMTTGYSCQGTCAGGQVMTMYGCLPQCGECGGMINGACIPGYSNTTTNGLYGYSAVMMGGGFGFYYYQPHQRHGWWRGTR